MSTEFEALQAVYQALEPLDDATRNRVLGSVSTLLGLQGGSQPPPAPSTVAETSGEASPSVGERPMSLVELMQEKSPRTNPERIATFAFYRDKYEGQPRFAREDLEPYFQRARLSPPGNYARDFAEALRRAWIHEDGSNSYLTTRGLEAVEAGFTGPIGTAPASRKRTTAKKNTAKKNTAKKNTAKKNTAKKNTAKKNTAKHTQRV